MPTAPDADRNGRSAGPPSAGEQVSDLPVDHRSTGRQAEESTADPPVELRRARSEEYAAVGRVTLGAYLADGYLEADDAYATPLQDAAARAETAELWVAGAGRTILGTVTFVRPGTPLADAAGDGEGELRMLAVAPTARGRGIGEALVRLCQRRVRAEGLGALVLSTLPDMAGAHRIYVRLGFVRTPERDWDPRTDVHLLTYRWTVD